MCLLSCKYPIFTLDQEGHKYLARYRSYGQTDFRLDEDPLSLCYSKADKTDMRHNILGNSNIYPKRPRLRDNQV